MDQFNGSQEELGAEPAQGPMTEDELRYVTDREINDSYSWTFGKIASERAKAEQYYLGLPVGDLSAPAIPGRSSIVSTDVEDTVEWLLPELMEVFTAGDDVVEFSPQKPGDEDGAQQTTDLVNHVFYQQNEGWYVLYTWIKDALIQKNGIVKGWWDNTPDTVREEYRALTDMQNAMLLQDDSVKPVEHSAYPDPAAVKAAQQQYQQAVQQFPQAMQQYQQAVQQHAMQAQQPQQLPQMPQGSPQQGQPPQGMPPQQQPAPQPPQPPQKPDPSKLPHLHDVALVRTTAKGKVCIENVPPEEFLISRHSKRIGDGPCGHRVKRTVTYLRQKGYQNVDQITSDDIANPSLNQEAIVRRSLEDAPFGFEDSDGNGDESMREVWLTEWYTQVDFDGDGIAEWRKIVRSGNALLENEPCDGAPFVSLCAVPLPHLFFGRSPAEQAMQTQRLKTTLIRGLVDNMQMQINGRTYAVNGEVNLDDLLTNRPGGVVRVKTPQSAGMLQNGMGDTAGAYQLLEYADTAKQERTGVMKLTQGSDADILNTTASGNKNMTDRSNQRVKLIARIMAETGIKDLMKLIQKLLAQYQDQAMTIKLRGEWVNVDPRAWKNQYDMISHVGLGTGDKSLAIAHLTTLGQAQQQAMQIGVATPQNIYNTLKKLPPLLGHKNADQFFTDPSKAPPKPQQPDPKIAQIQAQGQTAQQLEAQRQQFDGQKLQAEQQLETLKAHLDQQTAMIQQQAQMEQADQQTKLEAQRDLMKAHIDQQNQQMQLMFQAHMEELRQSVALQIAQISAASRIDVAETAAATTIQSAQMAAANQASQPENQ
jgi:hypothetical protein